MAISSEFDADTLGDRLIQALLASGHSRRTVAAWRDSAAWMFHRCGETWHELLLLHEVMSDFARAGEISTAQLCFFTIAGDLRRGSDPQQMARRCYELALKLAPQHAETHYSLGMLERRHDDQDSLERMQAVIALPAMAGAPGHARTIDNARWNCGEILESRGKLHEAARCYREALSGIGNIGPQQRSFPRLLQRLNEYEQSAAAFDAVMVYSHRYAPEFIVPVKGEGLMPPRSSDLDPADPFRVTRIGDIGSTHQLLYFAGQYFRFLAGDVIPASGEDLLAKAMQMVKPRNRWWFFRSVEPVCAPRANYWRGD